MFQKIAKHRANDATNDVHRPPLSKIGNDEDKRQLKEIISKELKKPENTGDPETFKLLFFL